MAAPEALGGSSVEFLVQEFQEPQTVPAEKIFCQLQSDEEYKDTISNETQKHLLNLKQYLEKNPESYIKVLRKRKVEEIESRGFFPWLKLRLLRWLHGDDCPSCLLHTEDTTSKLEALKNGMQMAHDYSEASKETDKGNCMTPYKMQRQNNSCTHNMSVYVTPTTTRKKQRVSYVQTEESSFLEIHMTGEARGVNYSTSSPRHPPPPAPPLTSKFSNRSEQIVEAEIVHPLAPQPPQVSNVLYAHVENLNHDIERVYDENTTPQQDTTISTCSPSNINRTSTPRSSFLTPKETRVRKHRRTRSNASTGSTSSRSSLLSDIQSTNPLTRLRTTALVRSPGGTPARQEPVTSTEPLHQALVLAFKNKFRNVRTPSPAAARTCPVDKSYFSPRLNFSP